MQRFVLFLLPLFLCLVPGVLDSRAASRVVLHPVDRLVVPGDEVMLKVRLMSGGLGFLKRPISGERIEFRLDDRVIGRALTGGDGWAVKRFRPGREGNLAVTAQLAGESPFEADPADLILSVIPPATPLLLVHLSTTRTPSSPPAVPFSPAPTIEPMEQAVEVLEALSESFQLVYLETGSESLVPRFREWIFGQGLPEAPLFVWSAPVSPESRMEMIKERIEELKNAGWRGLTAGITRSIADAEAMTASKMKCVLLVEDADDVDNIPEGVSVVTTWQEVSLFLIQGGGGRGNP